MKSVVLERSERSSSHIEQRLLTARAILNSPPEPFHNLRRAKVDETIFDGYPIVVYPDDLLVGRHSLNRQLTAEEQDIIDKAKSVRNEGGGVKAGFDTGFTGHRVIDYEKLLSLGIKGVLSEIDEQLSLLVNDENEETVKKRAFYESCIISLNAVCRFAIRHREKLLSLAESEANIETYERYRRIAGNFSKAPYEPCTHFYEAIQCMWFMQFCLCIADDITLTGHLDDYLYPFYKADLESGYMTREFAFSLIEDLYFKHNELYGSWPASVMLCGTGRDGKTVFNELSELCVDAIETTGLVNPSVAVCYTDDLPDSFLQKCIGMIEKGYSRPSIFNDRLIRRGLEQAGVTPEDACRYVHSTCVEITPVAAANILVATPYINLTRVLEHIFREKSEPYSVGKCPRVWPGGGGAEQTIMLAYDIDFSLSELDNFEKFFALVKELMSSFIESHVTAAVALTKERREYQSCPLSSAFINDCIARGIDAVAGGARYNFVYPNFPGVINLIDSLSAVRHAVYEQKILTLTELAFFCNHSFDGNARLRSYLKNRCPKFGNDDRAADDIAIDVYQFIFKEVRKYSTVYGDGCYPSYFAYIMHGQMGLQTDATPDGRLRGDALSEHLGSVQGMDRKGPLAVMRSIAKLDQSLGIGGIATNFRFSCRLLSTPEGNRGVTDFVRVFMDNDCFEIQFNCVDGKALREAQKNPEQYRTLLVRVAGYSDYFVNLPPVIQNEIIARTENDIVLF